MFYFSYISHVQVTEIKLYFFSFVLVLFYVVRAAKATVVTDTQPVTQLRKNSMESDERIIYLFT